MRNTAVGIPEITGNVAHSLHKHSWPDLMMEILLQERLFTLWFAQNELEKSVIRLFEVAHRGASTGCISHAHARARLHTHTYTHYDNQVSKKQDSCKQTGGNISSKRWYWCIIHVSEGEKKYQKWSISSHWSQVIIHTLVGQPRATQGWGNHCTSL